MMHAQQDELVMSSQDLLQAQLELYHHSFAFVRSMALRAATDLGIPGAIHHRGHGGATLSDIADDVGIHPTKLSHLRRLMRVLTISGVFTVERRDDGGDDEAVYKLTNVSRLLVIVGGGGGGGEESSLHLCPIMGVVVNPFVVTSLFSIREWFTGERAVAKSLFEVAHGCSRWQMIGKDDCEGDVFNAGMVADSRLVMEVLLREHRGIFEPLTSLVDVGGSHGSVAAAIAEAFSHVKCTVLDLPHVVAGAPTVGNVNFVAGDMFEYIPPANAVLLKWIMHCWQDEECIKILRRCKEAIPARDAGGKVIIIDMVVGYAGSHENVSKETQALFDVFMMYMDGVERDEHQWRMIFLEAGFSDYKITPIHGLRSVIEVYP
ncbi:hypothetical protein ACP4OV_011729 [Aristida adscensionis]